jgi:glycosyltransferase involved in cell wall biosynthesis
MRVVLIAFTNIEYTIELAEALSKLVDITLMMPKKHLRRFQSVMNPSVKLCAFYQPRLRHLSNFLFVYKMIKYIKLLNPDVIHIQRGHPWFNFALPFLKRYPVVTTIHDVILHTGDVESRIIPSFTHKIAISYANQLIVHGKKLKSEMMRESNKSSDEINVLNRGINSIYTRYVEEPVEEDKHSILFFGRIFEYKGLRYLIEAEPLITKEIPDVKIVIAGRGEDFQRYNEMMVNKEKYSVYKKHIPNEMVAELFQKASVVVLPYIDASQSGVVPLAYAFKKPVVVTNVGSLPEVVDHGKTGYIVPPKDSKKIAEAVIDLLKDDKKRRRMGEYAYKKANEELSWEKIAMKTVEVYKKATGAPEVFNKSNGS